MPVSPCGLLTWSLVAVVAGACIERRFYPHQCFTGPVGAEAGGRRVGLSSIGNSDKEPCKEDLPDSRTSV